MEFLRLALVWGFTCICLGLYAQVNFQSFPLDKQLYPRNLNTNKANVVIAGTVHSAQTKYQSLRLQVYRNDKPVEVSEQKLHYTKGIAEFAFTYAIPAELANYSFEIHSIDEAGQAKLETRAKEVVAGDAFIIQGQSNAEAIRYTGDTNVDRSPFIRVFGSGSERGSPMLWYEGQGNGKRSTPGNTGQWGLRLAKHIVDNQKIPVAIFNGAHGGKGLFFFQRNDFNPLDLNSNYGRLLQRVKTAGLEQHIRAIFWHQGESNSRNTSAISYVKQFEHLYHDWAFNYPSVEWLYVFQLRQGCPKTVEDGLQIQEAQRRLGHLLDKVRTISTHTAPQHSDRCHHSYEGYVLFADWLYPMLAEDLYQAPSIPNIHAPTIAQAELTTPTEITLRTTQTLDSLIWEAGSEWDFRLEGAEVKIQGGSASGNTIKLQLSDKPIGLQGISYAGHARTSSPFIKNTKGLSLLSFYNFPITTCNSLPCPPTIQLLHPKDGDVFRVGHDITIRVKTTTPKQDLASLAIQLDGRTISTDSLHRLHFDKPGLHHIRVEAKNQQGQGSVDEASIELIDTLDKRQHHSKNYYVAGFNEAHLSNWLDPSIPENLLDEQGQNALNPNFTKTVHTILDQSAKANHLYAGSATNRPSFKHNKLLFDGRNTLYTQIGALGGDHSAYTKFVVFSMNDFALPRHLLSSHEQGSNGTGHTLFFNQSDKLNLYHSGNKVLESTLSIPDSTPIIGVVSYNPIEGKNSLYINGKLAASSQANMDYIDHPLMYGSYQYESGSAHFGSLLEAGTFNTALNRTQVVLLSNYLALENEIPLWDNRYYTGQGTELIGIGYESASDQVRQTLSSAGLHLEDVDFLQDSGDYLLAAHNGASGSVLEGTSQVAKRQWFFEVTDSMRNGGMVSIRLDFEDLNELAFFKYKKQARYFIRLNQKKKYYAQKANTETVLFSAIPISELNGVILEFGKEFSTKSSVEEAPKVHFYPNPVNKRLVLELPQVGGLNRYSLTLINSLGELVLAEDIPFRVQRHEVDLTTLQNGLYSLRVYSSDSCFSERLLKLAR